MIQGITPGPTVMVQKPDLFWGLIASMWVGNLMLLVLNLPLVGLWVSLLKVPYRFLFPSIMVFCALGIYSGNSVSFDVYLAALFGVLGIVWRLLGFSPVPLLLGFVLGPMIEENLRRALQVSNGDPSIFLTRPISLAFIVISISILFMMVLPTVRMRWRSSGK
jgi:TctA family transporter